MIDTQVKICAQAQSWLGTPYHHAARIKGVGVDCAQLLHGVFVDELAMVPPPDVAAYPPDWMKHRSEEIFLAHVQTHAQEVSEPAPGDVALFRFGRCFAHAAIVQSWPVVIHADGEVGKVTLADATQGRLEGREVRFFRVRGAA